MQSIGSYVPPFGLLALGLVGAGSARPAGAALAAILDARYDRVQSRDPARQAVAGGVSTVLGRIKICSARTSSAGAVPLTIAVLPLPRFSLPIHAPVNGAAGRVAEAPSAKEKAGQERTQL